LDWDAVITDHHCGNQGPALKFGLGFDAADQMVLQRDKKLRFFQAILPFGVDLVAGQRPIIDFALAGKMDLSNFSKSLKLESGMRLEGSRRTGPAEIGLDGAGQPIALAVVAGPRIWNVAFDGLDVAVAAEPGS